MLQHDWSWLWQIAGRNHTSDMMVLNSITRLSTNNVLVSTQNGRFIVFLQCFAPSGAVSLQIQWYITTSLEIGEKSEAVSQVGSYMIPLLKTNEYQYPLQLDGWVSIIDIPFQGFRLTSHPFFFWGGWTKTGKAMVKPWVNLITSLRCLCSEETDLSSSNGFRHCRWQSQITSWRIRRYTFA